MSDFILILQSKPHNTHHLNRYITFIQQCKQHNVNLQGYIEKHHICPRAKDMFPEYSVSDWNIVNLTARQHFVAHIMLWKAYPLFRSPRFALFAMKNKNFQNMNSRIYQTLKEEIANSKLNKNVIVAKDAEGNVFRITKENPKWISGELVGVMKNTKCSENTRRAASLRWKGVSKPDEQNKKNSEANKLLKWYHNFQLNKTGRFKENCQPDGFVRVNGPHKKQTFDEEYCEKMLKDKIRKEKRFANLDEIRRNNSLAQKKFHEENPLHGIEETDLAFIREILSIYLQKPEMPEVNSTGKKLSYKRSFSLEYSKIYKTSLHKIHSIVNGKKKRILLEISKTNPELSNIIEEIIRNEQK